jgi:hypothetical protein
MRKQLFRSALLAALGLGGVTAAQAQSTDMLLGFNDAVGPTSAQNDYVVDLGAASLFTTTSTFTTRFANNIVYGTSGSNSFANTYGSDSNYKNNVAVGVVEYNGSPNPKTLYSTGLPGTINTWGAGNYANAGALIGSTSLGIYASTATGGSLLPWSSSVAASPTATGLSNPANPSGNSVYNLSGPVLTSLSSGVATLFLYESTLTSSGHTSTLSPFTEIGEFVIDANTDTATFTGSLVAVPEPPAYGLLAGAGLLVLALRRQFGRMMA